MTEHPKLASAALRVLVADDNEIFTQTFGWMLEALGHAVRLAHDGPSALAAAREFLPDVAMIDLSLPGLSGYEVCRQLRIEPGLEKCVLIAQTGWGQPEHIQRTQAAGFHHHLVKPVDIDRLRALLASVSPERAAA